MPKKKPKYQPVQQSQLAGMGLFDDLNTEYLYCPQHKAVFVKGHECPNCTKAVRTIYDDWEPSMDTPAEEPLPKDIPTTLIAAMSGCEPPTPGVYKIGTCTIHNMPYIIGISECPECKVDSLEWIRKPL